MQTNNVTCLAIHHHTKHGLRSQSKAIGTVCGCSVSQAQGENGEEMAKKRSSNKHRFLQMSERQMERGLQLCYHGTQPTSLKKCFHILSCKSDYVWSSINLDARKYIERHSLYWLFNHMDSVGRRVQPRHNHPMQTDTHPQNPRSPGVSHERNHYMTNPNHARFFFRKSLKMTHRCALFDSAKDG